MIKPPKLHRGDTLAIISLSWGGAGLFPHRYQTGKRQLSETFGVNVIETPHALKSPEWIYQHPQARADDLHNALRDPSIKGIVSSIGGDDSIRLLNYIDFDIIKTHPKIFIGFSDSTVMHFCFYHAGVTSFYGTSLMVGFAENQGIHQYQIDDINASLFSNNSRGQIEENQQGWTSELLDWGDPKLQEQKRTLQKNSGWRFLQGRDKVSGHLLGGCVEVLEMLKGTKLWPNVADWEDKILFLEMSEEMMPPSYLKWVLRNYAALGILNRIRGLLFGRPYHNKFWQQYDDVILMVLREENLTDLAVVSGMDFGHTCPTFSLPLGAHAEINPAEKVFSLLEAGVC
ncbi:S66 family peptidase [Agaribacter flavus]|uniref:S66 peptidase family protein n=1 Tax=Agaribacter flavus TaxID=1902781 RepID=A0ABV7FKY1_9ALTE